MSTDELVQVQTRDGVSTLTMNNPRRLNGWTLPMQAALGAAIEAAATDDAVGAVVLTGTGEYYSAGADLSGTIKLFHPKKLHSMIEKANHELFDQYIRFPKPILAAVNGHAIGAPVTSGTLLDAVIASDKATFRTPFARLGVPPEGCSSIHFARLLGADNAERILGAEGWKPNAQEALEIGLVNEVVPHDQLLEAAQAKAASWVREGKTRSFRAGSTKEELQAANARESREVADAFLSGKFLMNQYRFLASKKKTGLAMTFWRFE